MTRASIYTVAAVASAAASPLAWWLMLAAGRTAWSPPAWCGLLCGLLPFVISCAAMALALMGLIEAVIQRIRGIIDGRRCALLILLNIVALVVGALCTNPLTLWIIFWPRI